MLFSNAWPSATHLSYMSKYYNEKEIKAGMRCVVFDHNSVLLQHRDDIPGILNPNKWSLITGDIRPDETAEEGVKRELLEETGYIAHSLEIYRIEKYIHKALDKELERYVFICHFDGVQNIKCLEGQEIKFVPIDNLDKYDLISSHKDLIKEITHC